MNKEEFLLKLRQSLVGNIQSYSVEENLKYYTNYINEQISSGRNEAEVMQELGDPRMIAKTIIDMSENTSKDEWVYKDRQRQANNSGTFNYSEADESGDSYNENNSNYDEINRKTKRAGRLGCIISIVILAIIIILLRFVLSIASYFLIPILIVFMVVGLVRSLK